jgi:hypothetical protein
MSAACSMEGKQHFSAVPEKMHCVTVVAKRHFRDTSDRDWIV